MHRDTISDANLFAVSSLRRARRRPARCINAVRCCDAVLCYLPASCIVGACCMFHVCSIGRVSKRRMLGGALAFVPRHMLRGQYTRQLGSFGCRHLMNCRHCHLQDVCIQRLQDLLPHGRQHRSPGLPRPSSRLRSSRCCSPSALPLRLPDSAGKRLLRAVPPHPARQWQVPSDPQGLFCDRPCGCRLLCNSRSGPQCRQEVHQVSLPPACPQVPSRCQQGDDRNGRYGPASNAPSPSGCWSIPL